MGNKRDILPMQTLHEKFVAAFDFLELSISMNGVIGQKKHWSRN